MGAISFLGAHLTVHAAALRRWRKSKHLNLRLVDELHRGGGDIGDYESFLLDLEICRGSRKNVVCSSLLNHHASDLRFAAMD